MNIIIKRQFRKPGISFLRCAAAFTVVELLIAVLLAGLITSAALALYITQQKQLMVQDDISDMQSSMRAAAGELTERLRMAGYKLPDGFPCIITHNTNPDTVEVVANSNRLDNVILEHTMAQPSSDLLCDGHDVSGAVAGDTLYIYDALTMTGEYFAVSQVLQSPPTIRHSSWTLSKRYPQGSFVFKTFSYKYYIDNSNASHPNFVYSTNGAAPQIYAENITNLNFQYVLSSGAIVDEASSAFMIREAIINLAGRTDKADNEFITPYRNRTLTTRIKIRNLGDNR